MQGLSLKDNADDYMRSEAQRVLICSLFLPISVDFFSDNDTTSKEGSDVSKDKVNQQQTRNESSEFFLSEEPESDQDLLEDKMSYTINKDNGLFSVLFDPLGKKKDVSTMSLPNLVNTKSRNIDRRILETQAGYPVGSLQKYLERSSSVHSMIDKKDYSLSMQDPKIGNQIVNNSGMSGSDFSSAQLTDQQANFANKGQAFKCKLKPNSIYMIPSAPVGHSGRQREHYDYIEQHQHEKDSGQLNPSGYVSAHLQLNNAINTNSWSVVPSIYMNEHLKEAIFATVHGSRSKAAEMQYEWVGALGILCNGLKDERKSEIESHLRKFYRSVVVWPDDNTIDNAYNHYCKEILWPILHYQISSTPAILFLQYQAWKDFVNMSQAFADKIVSVYQQDTIIWINDYHMFLLPKMIRKKLPNANICFFFHVALPSSEVFGCLAKRFELLDGLLSSNVIGFQIEDYKLHFMKICSRFLCTEIEAESGSIIYESRIINCFSVSIGLNIEKYVSILEEEKTQRAIAQLKNRYRGKKLILARDKLSKVRGLKQKLLAYELFLKRHPSFRHSTILVQLGWSSDEHGECIEELSDIVGRINSTYSDISTMHQPIIFLQKGLPLIEYLALLAAANCFLVTSRREGMNLCSHEYILSQMDSKNSLILSEFVGSAVIFNGGDEKGAIIINPWDESETADAIYKALTLTEEEKRTRYNYCLEKVKIFDASHWVNSILNFTVLKYQEQNRRALDGTSLFSIPEALPIWKKASSRLLLLNLDKAFLSWSVLRNGTKRMVADISHTFNMLIQDPRNFIYVSSIESKQTLRNVFSSCKGIGLIAENGCFIRFLNSGDNQDSWKSELDKVNTQSLDEIREVIMFAKERIPGSYMVKSDVRTELDFSKSDDESSADWQASELANHLNDQFSRHGWRATISNKKLYVQPTNADKATAAEAIMMHHWPESSLNNLELLVCFGSDRNDEHLFSWINRQEKKGKLAQSMSVHVGLGDTEAKNVIFGVSGLLEVLNELALN